MWTFFPKEIVILSVILIIFLYLCYIIFYKKSVTSEDQSLSLSIFRNKRFKKKRSQCGKDPTFIIKKIHNTQVALPVLLCSNGDVYIHVLV